MDQPLTTFLRAMLIGFSIAAPVGPIGLLTMQRTLQAGMPAGFATGMGAAVADAAYGAIGAFGVRWLIDALASVRIPLALGGTALLLWMAWQTWRAPLADKSADVAAAHDLPRYFAGTFLLTLSNPLTILSFIAVFGSLAGTASQPASPALLVAGVFTGSAFWWLLLTGAIHATRGRLGTHWRHRINQASALVLASFAIWQLRGLA